MNAYTSRLKQILSSKRAGFVVVGLAMISRVIQLVYFFNIRVDGSFQVMATQNLLHGHGVSLAKVLPGDLSSTFYEPLINWPPGYSFLLAPFYFLTGNYVTAGIFVDILSAWLLIISSRKLLKALNVPLHLVNMYTFITGFFLYYFYVVASTDAIGISLFVTAFYFTIAILKKEKLLAFRIFLFSSLLVIIAFLKYLFIPVAFLIPLFLVAYGLKNRERRLTRTGLLSFAVLLIAVAALLVYQKSVSGSAAYISSPERGFFPGHLAAAYPFIPGAVVQPGSVRGVLPGKDFYHLVFISYQVIHWILFVLFTCYLFTFIFRSRLKNIALAESYFVISWFVSITITALLLILSLTVAKEEIIPGLFWTYLEEARYYGLPVVLIHAGIFIYFVLPQARIGKWKYVPYIIIVLLLPETIRGLAFDARRVFIGREEYSWQYEERFQQYADHLIRKKKKEFGVDHVVVTASSYMNSRISLYNHVPILYPVEQVNNMDSLQTSKPVLLLVVLDDEKKDRFVPFISSRQPDGQFDGFTFYAVYVKPG
jgi:hypothetical protein